MGLAEDEAETAEPFFAMGLEGTVMLVTVKSGKPRKVTALAVARMLLVLLTSTSVFSLSARARVLAFKASLLEDDGRLEDAAHSYIESHSLSPNPTYSRYVVEVSLGELREKMEAPADAASWYVAALQTSLTARDIACGWALRKLVSLRRQSGLSSDEKDVCSLAAQQSWRLLGMAGEPNLGDLLSTPGAIERAQGRPLGQVEM
jgi:hypothetical protein